MKLKEFSKLLEGYDPEIEIGIGYDGHFVRKFELDFGFVNDEALKEVYNPSKQFNFNEYHNTKVLTIARIID